MDPLERALERSCSRVKRPWLWLPSQAAHDLAPILMPMAAMFSGGIRHAHPVTWRGLQFPNPMGVAGGVDKTGQSLLAWQKLGAGFLEVGTVTPRPQSPNPGKIMDRSTERWALWNRMGFPGPGAEAAEKALQRVSHRKSVPLFVNIGKNRDTSNEDAHQDYTACMARLHPYADAFVVNISSPNTKSLRELQSSEHLQRFLEPIVRYRDQTCNTTPLLMKLSPDMEASEWVSLLETSVDLVDGWILTNTTQSRQPGSEFSESGGVSGLPLRDRSRKCLVNAISVLGAKRDGKLLVSVGGVLSGTEVRRRLDLGADLVQTYSGLVYQGPGFFKKAMPMLAR